MTDAEKYAYAAKAVGIVGEYRESLPTDYYANYFAPGIAHDGGVWNPRTRDTDAFSLMIRLGFNFKIDLPNRHASVHHHSSGVLIDVKLSGDLTDSTAAVREAIFQAAVAIGKATP